MRLVSLVFILVCVLAGCGGSSSSPASTPVSTVSKAAGVATIPQTSPVPTPRGGFPTANPKLTPVRLPTTKPVYIATPTPFPPSAYNSTLFGTVTDAKSGSPLSGAVITVGVSGRHVTTTDSFGRYHITFPSGPPVAVLIQMQGYAAPPAMGALRAHSRYRLNFKLVRVSKGHPIMPPPPMVFGQH